MRKIRWMVLGGLLAAGLGSGALAQAPANDDFANREDLGNTVPVMVAGSNVGATQELDEPNQFGSETVWYSWQPPSDGFYEVNTFGSDFDTVVTILTGDGLAGLTWITYNDDTGGPQSRAVFEGASSQRYLIQVAGYSDGDVGSISLEVLESTPPTPPEINSIELSPVAVDITTGDASVDVTIDVSTPDGMNYMYVDIYDPDGGWAGSASFDAEEGGESGVFTSTLRVPRMRPAGDWAVAVFISENNGDEVYFHPEFGEPFPEPFNGYLPVTNDGGVDVEAPLLTALTFTPGSVSPSDLPITVTASLAVTDDLAGVVFVSISFYDAMWGQWIAGAEYVAEDLSMEGVTDGVISIDIEFTELPAIERLYTYISLEDASFRQSYYGDAFDGDEPLPDGTLPLMISGAPTEDAYTVWLSQHPEIPEAMRGPGDDPEGDTFPNGIEFFLGLLPMADSRSTATDPNAGNAPQLVRMDDKVGISVIESTANQNLGTGTNAIGFVQMSLDGATWDFAPFGPSAPDFWHTIEPGTSLMMRYAVEVDPPLILLP